LRDQINDGPMPRHDGSGYGGPPPRMREERDYGGHRDYPPRDMPPRDMPPRDMPPGDGFKDDMPPRRFDRGPPRGGRFEPRGGFRDRRGDFRGGGGDRNEEKQRILKEGLCFVCKQQGHLARDCPQQQNRERGGGYQPREPRNHMKHD
jgi:hypothetical protein